MSVVRGARPAKPENASEIGFSRSLWSTVQRCWHGNMESRPKVEEVVTRLGEAAAKWNRLMPPHVPAEGVALEYGEEFLDSMEHCEFGIPILPQYYPSSNGTGETFQNFEWHLGCSRIVV